MTGVGHQSRPESSLAFPADGSHRAPTQWLLEDLARLEKLLAVSRSSRNVGRFATEEATRRTRQAFRRGGVLQMYADLGAAAAAHRGEVHRSGRDDVRAWERPPSQYLVLGFIDDLGVPFNRQPARPGGFPM
jgi:hypothetical protein